ncbi:MAG: hypothetical protein IKF64_05030 [Eubacterium sp.]|nr:hypothetical protein [Eubacterium sp.]
MAQFTTNDIDDAKKRVRDMQERTRQYSEAAKDEVNLEALKALIDILTPMKEKELTPLMLISLISAMRDECDKTLILALLYILL